MTKSKQIGHRNAPVSEENTANEGSITVDYQDKWGDEAAELINAVTEGPHYRKKRHTLLSLSDAAYHNFSQAQVFNMASCASKVAHYKWRQVDPAYEAAYLFLIGNNSLPGIARQQREQELDEAEQLAIGALAEARATLRLGAAEASHTLISALEAQNSYGPKWHERISAANSILDRADRDTATLATPALGIIDHAIMHVYHNDDQHAQDTRQAGLQEDNNQPPDSENPPVTPSKDDHEPGMSEEQPPPSADRDSQAARKALDSFFTKAKKKMSSKDADNQPTSTPS